MFSKGFLTCICAPDSKYFEIICLVNICEHRKEREERARNGRERNSKLLAQVDWDEDEESSQENHEVEVTHPVRQLCKTVDAFIYVVEASAHRIDGTPIEYCKTSLILQFVVGFGRGYNLRGVLRTV